ncbi:MAG: 5-formyltetrahydrofolate cyclo-ligase [Flavobacteriaceae bacterium]|jgi:5-formyltetrahydrofolate cyclo-ligase
MTKAETRRYHLDLRKQLTPSQMQKKQKGLMKHIRLFDLSRVGVVHLFLSIQKQKEPNTKALVDLLFGMGKKVVVPQTDFATKQMTHWEISPETALQTNTYGIPEPMGGLPIQPSAIDLVFVPLLGYDGKGQRVGYGQGFYDRFLSKCSPQTVFVGLSYFPPCPEITDCEPTDIRLHSCIHSEGIIEF